MIITERGLKKPADSDFYSVGIYNDNMDTLDSLIGRGHMLRITFNSSFVGGAYSISDGTDTISGTVPTGLVVTMPAEDGVSYTITSGSTLRHFKTSGSYGLHELKFAPISSVFADNDWETIADVAEHGLPGSIWNVGDEKPLTLIDGTELTVQIYGFSHDTIAGSTQTAGITFGLKYLLETPSNFGAVGIFSNGGYPASALSDFISHTLFDLFPDVIKPHIKTVSKTCTTVAVDKAALKLFAFAWSEVAASGAFVNDGTQYSIFSSGGSAIRTLPNGTAHSWWLRSWGGLDASGSAGSSVMPSGAMNVIYIRDYKQSNYINFGFCV